MMTITMIYSTSQYNSVFSMTHETRSSYPAYRAMSFALDIVRIQTDFNNACTQKEADTRMRLPVKYTMNCTWFQVVGDKKNIWYIYGCASYCSFPEFTKHAG